MFCGNYLNFTTNTRIILKLTLFLIVQIVISYSISLHANELDEIGPFQGQRNDFLPGESFFERNQYWASSVIQIDNEPFFNLSTRATSVQTQINYDFFLSIFGASCKKVNIMIFTDKHSDIENVENQFGQIIFDHKYKYSFRFFVKTFRGSNAIGFHAGDVDTLMRLMQKNQYMIIKLPSIGKVIYYDLRGFSVSLQRASKMCMAGQGK